MKTHAKHKARAWADVLPSTWFEGKTVKKLEKHGVNCLVFYFTDGTQVELEVEYTGHSGLHGMLATKAETSASEPLVGTTRVD